jgi:oligosaccharide repeat unit polymerase
MYWAFMVVFLVLAASRSSSIFHPYVAFVAMMCYYFSDFLVRGYDDQNLEGIPDRLVATYALLVLLILTVSGILAYFVKDPITERAIRNPVVGLRIDARLRSLVFFFGFGILFLELYKRGSTVNWDMSQVWLQSLAARGLRDWDVLAYTGNFIFALISMMLPLGATAMAYFVVSGTAFSRTVALPLYAIYIFVLLTDGSRTPLVISLVTLWVFWVVMRTSFTSRLIATVVAVALIAVSTSLAIQFRANGFIGVGIESGNVELIYHQDDNFYRTIGTMYYAENATEESWDPVEFYYTILVNPIPRAFWPGKPALGEDFFGDFKLWWTTIFYIGEFAAMFGPTGALLVSPVFSLFLYFILYRSARLLSKPFGIGAYALMCFYIYMCMRSMMSLTSFMYMPAFAVLLVLFMSRLRDQKLRRAASFTIDVA